MYGRMELHYKIILFYLIIFSVFGSRQNTVITTMITINEHKYEQPTTSCPLPFHVFLCQSFSFFHIFFLVCFWLSLFFAFFNAKLKMSEQIERQVTVLRSNQNQKKQLKEQIFLSTLFFLSFFVACFAL